MASFGQGRDTEPTNNSIAALGLRRAALRGMLGSPLIEADDQRDLREELLGELQSVGQSMARIGARNAIELCAKLDALAEEYRPGAEGEGAMDLLASIRRDVTTLLPKPAERSAMQTVRALHTGRPVSESQAAANPPAAEPPSSQQAG